MAVLSSEKRALNPQISNYPVLTKADLLWFLPFLAAAVFPVFWQLTALPILQWDEARLAVNAAEMVDNGKLLVTYFQGNPDMWNTKPPFQIWLLALSIKVFGYSEFAIRFPTVLAVLGTFGLLFWFGLRVFKDKLVAVLSVLVLVSSRGYMGYHVGRNGDYDAVMVFFVTLYTLSLFLYLEENNRKYWWLCVLGLTMAVLTKGIAGLMCAPALLVYVLYRRKLVYLFRQKSFYTGVFIFLFFTLGYYLLREQLNPGYLEAVYDNELGGRFLNTLEQHAHPWDWYLTEMRDYKYGYWIYLVPLSVWLLVWQKEPVIRRFTVLASLFVVIFMAIISSAQTKLHWYEAPVYPICAMIIALGFGLIFRAVEQYLNVKHGVVFAAISIAFICGNPYYFVLNQYLIEKSTAPKNYWDSMFGPVLKAMSKKYPDQKNIVFFQGQGQYPGAAHYYKLAYTHQGYRITDVNQDNLETVKPGQVVIVASSDLTGYLEDRFQTEVLYAYHASRVYRILNKK